MDSVHFRSGIELFNRQEFFAAHEVWEDVWRAAPIPERKFLQGLIQIAVAFHHYSTGNLVGAQSLLQRGTWNMAMSPSQFAGVELSSFLKTLDLWQGALSEGLQTPPFPQVRLRED